MEMSSLFTRRLSGSSSRHSFNEDALEQLEFNINDISRASSPASVTSISARSEGHSGFIRDKRYRGSLRGDDEYRRKYSKIKSELEVEKLKSRQLQQERVEEMRRLREAFESDRKLEIASLQNKLEEERKKEIAKLKEELIKQKDFELQQVLTYKENEKKHKESGRETPKSHPGKESKNKTGSSLTGAASRDDEEDSGGKDGDNDIIKTSEKSKSKVKSQVSVQSNKSTNDRRSKTSQGAISDDARNEKLSEQEGKTDNIVHSKEKARSTFQRRGSNVGRLVTKIEMRDASTSVDHKFQESEISKDPKEVVSKKNEAIQTNPMPKTDELYKESQKVIHKLEGHIENLKSENTSLQKEASDVKKNLETKCKEHKIREEEFMTLKAGYERELRTVINEHKKVALGNLEKLKQAETALKEATLTDEEIASLSQRHERQRRLSSSSLPAMPDETKKEDREREKNLQKKLGELQTQVQRLERRIALLRTENDTLRKKQDDHRPLEEKIKSLKKRNAELAAIARRLEEKAKTLQQENSRAKSRASTVGTEDSHVETDQLKRAFARQRAKDLAEHAKSMLAKDHEIEQLRQKCQELANDLGNGELLQPQNAAQFEEKEELVNIIKQAAKERLQLEQQIANTKQRGKGDGKETPTRPQDKVEDRKSYQQQQQQQQQQEHQRRELEEANQILHQQVEKLENALHKTDELEKELTEKTKECQELGRQLSDAKERNRDLEKSLLASTARNDLLQTEVRDLHAKVKDIAKITEECNGLKQNLVVAQKEREAAQEEVNHLNVRVQSLESLVRDLQEASDKVGQLENEKEEAVHQLQQTQGQVNVLQQNHQALESEHESVVRTLREQVKALEERRKTEEERGENLAREVAKLQKEAEARQRALQEAENLTQVAEEELTSASVVEETFVSTATLPALATPKRGVRTQKGSSASEVKPNRKSGVPTASSGPCEDPELNELALKLSSLVDEISECSSVEGNPEDQVEENREMDLKNSGRPVEGSESFLSSWAQNGPIQVYIAKYNYDPFEYSPNENPEAELPLSAGDYVLIVGDMDEDGFFDGELIDGRQGLVPSNFIEKVEDDDLADFHAALMEAGHGEFNNSYGPSLSTSRPLQTGGSNVIVNNNNINSSNNNNNSIQMDMNSAKGSINKTLSNGSQQMDDSNSDLEDIAEMDEDSVSVNSRVLANGGSSGSLPPCPRSLSVDRQLSSSLMVSWKGPEVSQGLEVHAFHVLVDGQLKTSVKASERTKALLEGVDVSVIHRVCVQCLSNRGQSRDAQCTMLVGKDVYPQPSDLKISHLSPTSATLSWLPGNSNYQHSIVVNGKEMRLVKPGVFRHTLTGLSPGTMHQVTLIAKSISGTLNEERSKRWMENVSVHTEFTTPEAGSPEPPLNVQAENGPRERTLLLTWLPVTINASGVSNGTVVSGYRVVADGRQVKSVAGATTDHVILDSSDFRNGVPAELTLRTVSTSGVESVDSDPVLLPLSVIQKVSGEVRRTPTEMGTNLGGHLKPSKASRVDDQKGHDTDEEIEAAFREVQHSPNGVDADMASEPYTDTSSSELSDIPEVEEELLGSNDSNLNKLGGPVTNEIASSHQMASESPKPAPRKNVGADSGTKEFTSQKPDSGKLLMAPARVVPAIEITRDSSSDRGASLDEETDRDSLSSTRNTPTQRSTDSSVAPNYRSSNRNPSAFRQVDQSKTRDGKDKPQSQSSIDDQTDSSNPNTKNSKSHPGWNAASSSSIPEAQAEGLESTPHSGRKQSPDHRKNVASSSSQPDGTLDAGGDTDSISGEINSTVDENSVRLFIALFDYDPVTMSPNVDSIDEELPFREGQILKVYGDKDLDGFYRGESQGRNGFIPCNMVSEVQIDDQDLVDQLLKESMANTATSASSQTPTNETEDAQVTQNRVPPGMRPGAVRRMVAMYDYDPHELSPNVDAELELSFKTGDIIIVYGDMDEDGFFNGEANGQQGLVPSNFLQPAPLSDEDGLESSSVVSATPRSRSGESLETSLNAVARADMPSNISQMNEQTSPNAQNRGHSKMATSGSPTELRKSEADLSGDQINSSLSAEEEKPKKKTGFFNRSKNIFKKLTR